MGFFKAFQFIAFCAAVMALRPLNSIAIGDDDEDEPPKGPQFNPYPFNPNVAPRVRMDGRQILVDGKPFFIKGVCYSPVPIGENPNFPPDGDYFGKKYAYIWKRDLALVRALGATTIRLYGWDSNVDHNAFLDEVHAHGLMVLITFFLGMSSQNPVATPQDRQKIITNFATEVSKYAEHPAILMWSFGNELNGPWNGFIPQLSDSFQCGWNQGCLNNPWGGGCFAPVNCVYTALFTFINDAAQAAKSVSSKLITSGFADLDNFISTPWQNPVYDKIPQFEHMLTHMDAWAMQLYRGKTFGNYFVNFAAESSKPLIITEFGVDAYNDPCGWQENIKDPVCFNMYDNSQWGGDVAAPGKPFYGCVDTTADCALPGVEAQKNWDVGLATEIMASAVGVGGAVAGGFLMAWTDEYWKGTSVQDHCNNPCPIAEADACRTYKIATFLPGGTAECSPHAHFTCDNPDTTYHDICGYWLYSAPDHYVNEQWFGITTPIPCGQQAPEGGFHLDSLYLRPVYYAIQKLWTGGNEPVHSSSCDELLPCYHCLRTFMNKQIELGSCDPLCRTTYSVSPPPTPRAPWISQGFWRDYHFLILGSVFVGLLVLFLAIIKFCCQQRTPPTRHAAHYGSIPN